MKPIRWTRGEGRRDRIRFGNDLPPTRGGSQNPKTTGVMRPVIIMAGSAWSECGEVRWRQAGRSPVVEAATPKPEGKSEGFVVVMKPL